MTGRERWRFYFVWGRHRHRRGFRIGIWRKRTDRIVNEYRFIDVGFHW